MKPKRLEQTPFMHACALDELRRRGRIVVRAADRPVVIFYNDGAPRAVDNRCPHLGFPLHRGSIDGGMVTCHWHHARFDAISGCTFDLWADDVPPYEVRVEDGHVYVAEHPRRRDSPEHGLRRLHDGMEHNIGLVMAKAILTLEKTGVEPTDILREAALFGTRQRDGWAMGLTVLTAMANLLASLGPRTAYLALYQGVRRTAADCSGQTPHRQRSRLETTQLDEQTLERWLRYWTLVRHRDGAERTLLTAIENPQTRPAVGRLLLAAATDRAYADGGHLLDFANKALELLDLVGLEHTREVLPAIVGQLVAARGGEEVNAWRHPIDLVPLMEQAAARLVPLMKQDGRGGLPWTGEARLADEILGDDPAAILDAVVVAAEQGAPAAKLSKALAYAAAMRIARFGTANEIGDWVAALHSFSYCNALDQAILREPHPALTRGILHGAMSVYLNRFLNVPPAKLPDEASSLDDLSRDGDVLLEKFLEALDNQQQVDLAARLAARHMQLDHPVDALIDTFTQAAVREDADFHTLQMLEAGIRQHRRWGHSPQGDRILVAVARYLAAHCPTPRAQLQTATIALRLHRGEKVYEDVGEFGVQSSGAQRTQKSDGSDQSDRSVR